MTAGSFLSNNVASDTNVTLRSSGELCVEHCGGYTNNKTGSHIRYEYLFRMKIFAKPSEMQTQPKEQV
jgi:hypothetical protein